MTAVARETSRGRTEVASRRRGPDLSSERALWGLGHEVVAGIDEVGKGAWAGPLTVGVAILPRDRRIYRVNDSKQLTAARREALFDRIAEWCVDWAVGHASADECDRLGMSEAQRVATDRALGALRQMPDAMLVDGKWNFIPEAHRRAATVEMMVKGDGRSLSIAAASILAKVTRDRIMAEMAGDHPLYGWEHNKGYPSARHRAALSGYGLSCEHRRSWAFVDALPWPTYHRPVTETVDQPTLFSLDPLAG